MRFLLSLITRFQTRWIKNIGTFVLSLLFVSLFIAVSFAETVSLYSSLDDSSSQANLLVDLMVNDPYYDPSYQYNIVRAGERDYRIYFAPDLSNGDIICIQYIPSFQLNPASVSRYSVNSLNIIQNGYIYCGNTPGSARHAQANNYSFQQIVISIAVFVAILIGFKVFRKRFHIPVGGYKI